MIDKNPILGSLTPGSRRNFLDTLRAENTGAILLLHDTRADPETLGPGQRLPSFDRAEVLESILASTRAGGLREATVSELTARYSVVRSIARERMVAP